MHRPTNFTFPAVSKKEQAVTLHTCYLRNMGIQRIMVILIFSMITSMTPALAVNTEPQSPGKELEEEKKLDELSVFAYISAVAGIASFFFIPAASLLFLPAGLVMGMIAIAGGRKRYEKRRGRGLALAAIALGGVFVLAVFASLVVSVLFGF